MPRRRVTKPYTEEQWSRIEALGRAIDGDLTQQDVRLTMGGEPTFVSIDDRDAAAPIFDEALLLQGLCHE